MYKPSYTEQKTEQNRIFLRLKILFLFIEEIDHYQRSEKIVPRRMF